MQAFWLLRQVLLNVYFWLTTRSIPQDLIYCHLLRCTVFLFVHVLECLGYALGYVSVPITLGAGQRCCSPSKDRVRSAYERIDRRSQVDSRTRRNQQENEDDGLEASQASAWLTV